MRGPIAADHLTIPAIMRRAAMLFGEARIVSRSAAEGLHRYRYADMIHRGKQLAVALRDLGVGPGDRVGTLAWNQHQHLETYFAVPSIGAVLHTLNLRLHPSDLAYIIQHAGDRVIVADRALLPLIEPLPDTVEHVVVIGEGGELRPRYVGYEGLIAGADAGRFAEAELDERDAAAMCYTSGTTGRPKGVSYSHRSVVLQSMNQTAADSVAASRRDVMMAVVPMFHINGWGFPFTAALVGATLVLPGSALDPDSLLALIASERVTVTAGVPTIWQAVLQRLDEQAEAFDVRSLRALVIGGSAVPKAVVRGFRERHGVPVLHAWGMTETTSLATVNSLTPEVEAAPVDIQDEWLTKQGPPVPFVEIRARGDAGLVPWDGRSMGELEVRGPTVACEYYRQPDADDRFTDDGWFRTGDVVTITAAGCVEIHDRSKDLIRSGGEWISSVALENALMGHPDVAEAAVIAVPDEKWLERPLAAIVLKPGRTVGPEALREHLAPDFAKWWLPDRFEFVDAIPRTSTGKFMKAALRERFRTRDA